MRIATLAFVAVYGLLSAACQPGMATSAPGAASADILIGSDMPTSGAQASATRPLEQAIQLAIDQHPVIGRFKLAYLPLDDALLGAQLPQKGIQNVKRMIADPRVLGMVGPYNSDVAAAEIPVANVAQLAMISPSNSFICLTQALPVCPFRPDALRPSGSNNYFRTAPPDPVEGRAMARYVAANHDVRRAAAFTLNPDLGNPIIDSFAAELDRTGGQLVLREVLPAATTDFTEFLAAARARGAQAIYAADPETVACKARAQMKGIFPEGTDFLGVDGVVLPSCVAEAEENADGMLGTVGDVDPTRSTDAAVKLILGAYRKAYPNTSQFVPYTFAAYDCARVLIDAIARAVDANGGRIPTRAQVVEAVAHSQFKGVTGTYVFDANGDAISPLMSIYRVEKGQWVYLQQIDASSKQS